MGKNILLFGFMLFGASVSAYAQLSHTFTQTAHINDGGNQAAGFGVTVAPDGTVFLANYGDGLRAYRYDGTSFTNTAHIDDGGAARNVALASDGTVFLANGDDGLRAYRYDGTSFTNTAHIYDGGVNAYAFSVAVAPDDGTVFLVNGMDGLRAYSYDGNSFTNTAHIDDGGENDYAEDVFVAPDGTIFLANGFDGLRVYKYDGTTFSNAAHDNGTAQAVAVDSDGTVFVAGCPGGQRAYRYDGTSLARIAEFENKGCPSAGALALAPDGTVFLAIAADVFARDVGLWAYRYDNASFSNTAHINPPDGFGVAVAADGTVFLAGRQGLFAFTYSGATTDVTNAPSLPPREFELFQNYPNPFNPATTIAFSLPQSGFVTLKVYNLLGEEVATLLEAHKPAGRHSVTFDASALASGLYYYTLTAGDFKQSRKMVLMR